MEVEQRAFDSTAKAQCSQQLTQFKSDLQTLRRDFDRSKEANNRDYLFDVTRTPSNVFYLV